MKQSIHFDMKVYIEVYHTILFNRELGDDNVEIWTAKLKEQGEKLGR